MQQAAPLQPLVPIMRTTGAGTAASYTLMSAQNTETHRTETCSLGNEVKGLII